MSHLHNTKIKEWRVFIKVVENKTITAAAASMNLEASTVSKYLAQLEDKIGIPLIERNTRNMRVTPEGLKSYGRISQLLEEMDSFIDHLKSKNKPIAGSLSIAAPAIVCDFLLSEWISDFQKIHPDTRFHLQAIGRNETVSFNDYDIVIRGGQFTETNKNVHKHRIDSLNLIVCANPEYVQSHSQVSHPVQLLEHELLTLWNHSFSGPVEFRKKGENDFVLNPSTNHFTTNSVLAQFNLMLRGAGITVATPSWLAYEYLQRGELVRLLPDWSIKEYEVFLLWKVKKYYSRSFMPFVEYLELRWRSRKKIVDN